jgi:23S rRNA (uridine2552-2'-O)-methyltransferase
MANKQWRRNQGQDRYFRQAKAEGYRARSAYKLQEINNKYRVIRSGDRVLDIGAAPGSWSQVTRELVGDRGLVVAVDLQAIQALPGVTIIKGDIREAAVRAQIEEAAGADLFNTVISDIAPSTTGVQVTDHARSIELSLFALTIALQLLRKGGNFVTKVFGGEDFDMLLALTKRYFRRVAAFDPDATRKESKETFIVANNLFARANLDPNEGLQALLEVEPETL